MADDEDSPEGKKIGEKFIVLKYIAKGSFGRLHVGKNIQTGEKVAIKFEKTSVEKPQLVLEFPFFKKLKADRSPQKGIPRLYYFGPCGDNWSALVMDLLGPSLEDVKETVGGKYSLRTTLLLAIQLIDIFEYFHGVGLIYRDTKPENFLYGPSGSDKYNVVHIIDFGLCKQYIDDNGKHIPFRDRKGIIGTARYMSINNHKGYEQSRRDDMEAIGYMLVYFLKGELPWMGIKIKEIKERYNQILKVKQRTTTESLCADIPVEFCNYLKDIKSLEFADEPKYREYSAWFKRLLRKKSNNKSKDGEDIYDFNRTHQKR
ncbi:casein kinase I-like [Oppia nitens]|uniref:casein kinase I-like n=1 Tax=Oppia nitens TaxID=1686743 RepID=UPI0023DC5993|nr:casein kinase I-like [Oppia nitens]